MTYISTTPWRLERMEFGGDLGGWQEDLEEWAQSEGSSDDQLEEGRAMLIKKASDYTDTHVNPVGRKPILGEEDVHLTPLPDFASASGEMASPSPTSIPSTSSIPAPVSPSIRHPPTNAWWLPSPSGKFHSAEGRCGISHAKIKPGEEKFVLLEGSSWKLKRKGKQDVIFTVTLRLPNSPPSVWARDAIFMSFTPMNV